MRLFGDLSDGATEVDIHDTDLKIFAQSSAHHGKCGWNGCLASSLSILRRMHTFVFRFQN